MDRVLGLSMSDGERMEDTGCSGQGWNCVLFALTPDSSLLHPLPVHVFLSHPAGGFNNFFRPVSFPVARAIGPDSVRLAPRDRREKVNRRGRQGRQCLLSQRRRMGADGRVD